jgi:TetR/AcrR family transcriptional regulator, regulator of cefoperazone and chloramphenicol sensitivity
MRSQRGPRRHPRHGGYERGHATREHIINTALRVFGAYGYDQASTRQIAAEAGVNPPALQYYFDGKEGLHRACAEFIIERAAITLAPALAAASQVIARRQRSRALASILAVLDALTDSLAEPESESWSRFIARGRSDGAGPAIGMLRKRLGEPVMDTMLGLIALATGTGKTDKVARLRMLMILGQARWIHASRAEALAVMGWTRLDAPKRTLIKRVLREHTRAALKARRTSKASR